MFSKSCKYAIKAVLLIAKESQKGKRTQINDISKEIGSPKDFTYKILQRLVRLEIIKSERGTNGGFEIEKSVLNNLKLYQITKAIDGDDFLTNCALGLSRCNSNKPCPVHDDFIQIKNMLKSTLENTKITSLVEGLNEELTFLKF